MRAPAYSPDRKRRTLARATPRRGRGRGIKLLRQAAFYPHETVTFSPLPRRQVIRGSEQSVLVEENLLRADSLEQSIFSPITTVSRRRADSRGSIESRKSVICKMRVGIYIYTSSILRSGRGRNVNFTNYGETLQMNEASARRETRERRRRRAT